MGVLKDGNGALLGQVLNGMYEYRRQFSYSDFFREQFHEV
jgi:hypothetical protein